LTLTPNEARPPVPDLPRWVTDPGVRRHSWKISRVSM
jgi:hypothetical protein